MKDFWEKLKPQLLEAAFVALGVVLGLFADEWRTERELREHSEKAMTHVHDEIRANRSAVADALEYHQAVVDKVHRVPDMTWDQNPFRRGFIAPAQTYHTAWESAQVTDAFQHRDYRQILELARVYADQAEYERQAAESAGLIYEAVFKHGTRSIFEDRRNLADLLNTFIYREKGLLETYDKALRSTQIEVDRTDR